MMDMRRERKCVFCEENFLPDYKDIATLQYKTSERGKILPKRVTGTCSRHQRKLARAIKRARFIGFLPYVSKNLK